MIAKVGERSKMNIRLFVVPLMCLGVFAPQARPDEPRYTSDGQLMRPDDYREWIYLSSGLGMTYGLVQSPANAASQRFDNVFVQVADRLGNEGEGLRRALESLTVGRLALPAACLGNLKQCLRLARLRAPR